MSILRFLMHNIRALIVGLTRESASYIESEVNRIYQAFHYGSNLNFFIVESDSCDETVNKLNLISKKISTFNFISLGVQSEQYPNRIHRLQRCRNTYVEYIRSFPREEWDLIIVADFDRINSKLGHQNLENLINLDFEWAGLMANQCAPYYDILALRANGWVEEDCFLSLYREKNEIEHSMLSRRAGIFTYWKLKHNLRGLRQKYIYSKMLKLPTCNEYISVESAFGGLAIYKPEVFFEADYGNPFQNSMNICEHVLFNTELVKKGFKLFIKLDLINSGWNEHNLNKIKIVRLFRRAKHALRKHILII